MAESGQNRTERATPKRKAEARRKGQVALSRDATAAAGILGSLALLYWLTMPGMASLIAILQHWLLLATDEAARRTLTLDHLHLLLGRIGSDVFMLLVPFMAGIAVVGIGANLAQTGFLWRQDALQLDPTRVDPMKGFSRLCSLRSLTEIPQSAAENPPRSVGRGFWRSGMKCPGSRSLTSMSCRGFCFRSAGSP